MLALAPDASVAVMVVAPGPTPVARPEPSIGGDGRVAAGPRDAGAASWRPELEEPVVVPFPSWPHSLAPQHRTVPSAKERAAVVPPPGGDGDGAGDSADRHRRRPVVVVPSPSCPNWFSPQQRTVPFARSAQVCRHPALTVDGAGNASHLHRRGRRRGRPVAELPAVVFAPAPHRTVGQHRARVDAPAADGGGTSVRPLTGTGVDELVYVPSPSCPLSFRPQHRSVPSPSTRAGVIRPRS